MRVTFPDGTTERLDNRRPKVSHVIAVKSLTAADWVVSSGFRPTEEHVAHAEAERLTRLGEYADVRVLPVTPTPMGPRTRASKILAAFAVIFSVATLITVTARAFTDDLDSWSYTAFVGALIGLGLIAGVISIAGRPSNPED